MQFSGREKMRYLQRSTLPWFPLSCNRPDAETSSRKIGSLHPLVKILHNYTTTNPEDICGQGKWLWRLLLQYTSKHLRTDVINSWWTEALERGAHCPLLVRSLPSTPCLFTAFKGDWPLHEHTWASWQRHRHLQQHKHLPTLERFQICHTLRGAETSAGSGKVTAHTEYF